MNMINDPTNDPLWKVAKKRAKFKKSLTSYVIVIPFLWAIWFFSNNRFGRYYDYDYDHLNYFNYHLPWPAWVMIGWGFGLAFKFAHAYWLNTKQSIESEYEKLKNQYK